MKKATYATIAIFVIIMIVTIVVAQQKPVQLVKYENGTVQSATK